MKEAEARRLIGYLQLALADGGWYDSEETAIKQSIRALERRIYG